MMSKKEKSQRLRHAKNMLIPRGCTRMSTGKCVVDQWWVRMAVKRLADFPVLTPCDGGLELWLFGTCSATPVVVK